MTTTVKISALPANQAINTASGTGTLDSFAIGQTTPEIGTFISVSTANLQAIYNQINEIATNGNASIAFNFNGYNSGTTQYRDVQFFNGKNGLIGTAVGATGLLTWIGGITAATYNGLAITTSTGTLNVTNGKAINVSNTLTFTGTDSSSVALGAGGTVAYVGTAQTWNAVQTFTNSDIKLLGSSTGATTFTSANASSTNYTLTFPAVTDTLAGITLQQSSKSAAYTTVLADAGTQILHPASDNNARTFTIDSNANVAYAVGTLITFVNLINTVTIAITSDTMYLAGTGTTGSRTLAVNGVATAFKVASTTWIISGTGLS